MKSYNKLTKNDISIIVNRIGCMIYISDKCYGEKFKQLKLNDMYYPFLISSFGRIFSLNYKKQKGNVKELKTIIDKDGYYIIPINYQGVKKLYKVHRLVALTFIKNNKNKPEVNHIDGDKSNNKVMNLEWCTTQENIIHAHTTGLAKSKGEYNSQNVYSEKQIIKVCELLSENNMSMREISKFTDVGYSVVNSILHGKSWNHISANYDFSNYTCGKDLNKVINICKLAESGLYTIREISELNDVKVSYVKDIILKRTHKAISNNYNISNYKKKNMKI